MHLTPIATLKRRIQKLGDHYGAARRLCAICATPDINRYLKNLDFQEVSLLYQRSLYSFIILIFSFRSNPDTPTTASEATNSQSTHCHEFLQDRRRLSACVSQCSAIHWAKYDYYQPTLRSRYRPRSLRWIDSVWAPHWNWDFEAQLLAVQGYFRYLESKSGHKFRITDYQEKLHAGWHYPVKAGEAIRNVLLEILHKELGELRRMADPRRRSDSFPVSSPEANGEQSNSGEEINREDIDAIGTSRAAKKTRPALDVRNL